MRDMRRLAFACVGAGLVGMSLVGCEWLPAAGPSADDVASQAVSDTRLPFDLIDIDSKVVDTLAAQRAPSFHSRFSGSGLPPEQRVSVGDTVSIQIWSTADESSAPPLSPSSSSTTHSTPTGSAAGSTQLETIPGQLIMRDGALVVPYAGRVPVAGRSPTEVERSIESRLKDQMINPQVIISIDRGEANTAAVAGEVLNGARVQLSPQGTRLLEVIASAGGIKYPTYEIVVRLSRGRVTAIIPYDALVANPEENIYVYPRDIITLEHVPQTFDAFGATGKVTENLFPADSITLAQALGITSGVEDTRADPAGIFLMRYEPQSLVRQLTQSLVAVPDNQGIVPVIFHLDLRDAGSFLLAQRFTVKDRDAIFVADAKLTGLQKFFSLFGTVLAPGLSAGSLAK